MTVYFNLIVMGVAVMTPFQYQLVIKGLTGSKPIHLLVIVIRLLPTITRFLSA